MHASLFKLCQIKLIPSNCIGIAFKYEYIYIYMNKTNVIIWKFCLKNIQAVLTHLPCDTIWHQGFGVILQQLKLASWLANNPISETKVTHCILDFITQFSKIRFKFQNITIFINENVSENVICILLDVGLANVCMEFVSIWLKGQNVSYRMYHWCKGQKHINGWVDRPMEGQTCKFIC